MRKAIYFLLLVLCTGPFVEASSTKVKTYRTFDDFIRGESKGVGVSHDGRLVLAPQIDTIFDTNLPQIWRLVRVGQTLYAAAGTPAAILRIGAKGDTATVFHSDAASVFALAADAQGTLWFAPSPGGELYRFDGRDAKKVADLDVTYIWDILPRGDGVLVATGEPGNLVQVGPDGSMKIIFESPETHLRSLAMDARGQVYAGTADGGLIYRFDTAGKPFVLYDSPQTEIFAILPLADGSLWVAATREGVRPSLPSTASVRLSQMQIEGEETGGAESLDQPSPSVSTPAPSRGASSALYRITPRGVARDVWKEIGDRVQSLCPAGDGGVLVGTGEEGRIYFVDADGKIDLVADLDPAQVTHLLPGSDGEVYAATSNLGAGFRIRRQSASRGEFLAPVIDAEVQARWGSLSWKSAGKVQIFVRSGNSEKPDKTWSPWFGPLEQADGSAISAPSARFLQWRAVLLADGGRPELREVSVGYMQENVPPIVESITIYRPGVAYPEAVDEGKKTVSQDEASAQSATNGRSRSSRSYKREEKPGYQSVAWKASDPNDDALVFDLYYKMVDAPVWRTLVENYRTTVYSWDSRALEDGTYLIKVVARDDPGNPPDLALKAELISEPFVIDNTPPEISELRLQRGKPLRLQFTARDVGSRIQAAYYALDAQEWMILYPADGIADSFEETFDLLLKDLKPGEHILTVKVYDANDNVRYRHLSFTSQ